MNFNYGKLYNLEVAFMNISDKSAALELVTDSLQGLHQPENPDLPNLQDLLKKIDTITLKLAGYEKHDHQTLDTLPADITSINDKLNIDPIDHQSNTLNKIESTLTKLEHLATQLKKNQLTIQKEYLTIYEARGTVIDEMNKALKAYRAASIKWQIKEFLCPRIGKLYQYSPRRFQIPKRYYQKAQLKNMPKISIVTPSYNQGQYIERTLMSVLEQHYSALEFIVQDGGSNDETVNVLKRYHNQLTNWESKKDTGQSNAINLGFHHATGEIMAYLNSDDILLPGTLHYVAQYFEKNPDVDVVYGHRIIIDEADREIGRWVLPAHDSKVLTWADYIPQETLFWRRSIWNKVGGEIDESFRFAMDWDLLLRFDQAGAKFKRLPRFMGAFRVHTQQKTSSQMNAVGSQEMDRLRMRCHKKPVSYMEISKNIRRYLIKHVLINKLYRIGLLRY
ncbi:MAG: glycosyltransferase family 2 protein [Gammaproteobacteria bacterium]